MEELKRAALNAVKDCLNVQAGEKVLVICDEPLRRVGYYLWEAAKGVGADAMVMEIIPRSRHGEEPPDAVAQAMSLVDVVIAPTTASLTHTNARRAGTKAGARIATLPDITEEIMSRTLNADYTLIEQETKQLFAAVSQAKTAKITSDIGTQLILSVQDRIWHLDTGIYHKSGEFGNLPGGECYVAPLEGSANGVMVIDGSMAGYGRVDQPVIVTVKNGLAVKAEGGEAAKWLADMFISVGEGSRNIAELGIGTNDKAKVSGKLLEDEKVKGTIHIAFGNNASFGGKVEVPMHIDSILMDPSLEIDGQKIIVNGKHIY